MILSHLPSRRGLAATSLALLVAPLGSAFAPVALADDLLAHRAVYELTLEASERDSRIEDAAGLFVFQVTGSACAGWTIVSDIVLSLQDRAGGTIRTETQYRAFEDPQGEVFTFQTQTSTGAEDETLATGAAERQADGSVTIRRFESDELAANGAPGTLFPNQLTVAMLEAARAGESFVFATVFDGSHDAGLAQPATALIGSPVAPTVTSAAFANAAPLNENAAEADHLAPEPERWTDFPPPSRAWPITLSYFDPLEPDSEPNFQVAYTLDTNGVSDGLVLDYGAFSLRGVLSDFTAFEPASCVE